jgi:hypothetical protein
VGGVGGGQGVGSVGGAGATDHATLMNYLAIIIGVVNNVL